MHKTVIIGWLRNIVEISADTFLAQFSLRKFVIYCAHNFYYLGKTDYSVCLLGIIIHHLAITLSV